MAAFLSLADWRSIIGAAKPWKTLVERASGLTSKLQLLLGLSLGIGAISTLATVFAFFWFVRIKRCFRHDLIMLLVQADFVKSLAFVIFPIVQYANAEPIASRHGFCQFSGFLLSLGIEASDMAVLLIAVHSAMYIRRPRSGLSPYRWWAYAAYVVVPTLLASLTFADTGGYDNLGAYCYLAKDHGWSRLALSWVPRYVLLSFIITTYLCIYIYVRRRIDHYDRRESTKDPSMTTGSSGSRLESSTRWHTGRQLRESSMTSLSGQDTDGLPRTTAPKAGPIRWTIPFYNGASSSHGQAPSDEQDPHYIPEPSLASRAHNLRREARYSSARAVASSSSSSRPTSRKPTLVPIADASPALPGSTAHQDPFDTLPHHPYSILGTKLFDGVLRSQQPCSPMSDITNIPLADVSPGAAYKPQDELHSEVSRNRERIRRQLRSLVYYPLIYLLTWLFPLMIQAFAHRGKPPAFWLSALGIIGFAVQGFANVVVFTSREKPWRHAAHGKSFLAGVRSRVVGSSVAAPAAGRTRDEMMIEARTARARRAAEMRDESLATSGVAQNNPRQESSNRNWWDISDFDDDLEREDEEAPRRATPK